ncbi:unnamed protein product, partial [Rotaria sp. Silwood2]
KLIQNGSSPLIKAYIILTEGAEAILRGRTGR